jgi:hypothetical protein
MLIEKIKCNHSNGSSLDRKYKINLSQQLNHDYTYLSNLFSEVQGTTIDNLLFLIKRNKRIDYLW